MLDGPSLAPVVLLFPGAQLGEEPLVGVHPRPHDLQVAEGLIQEMRMSLRTDDWEIAKGNIAIGDCTMTWQELKKPIEVQVEGENIE